MLNTSPLPVAWLGYAKPHRGASRACVRVCMDCPDKAQADAEAARANHDVTHTLCARHAYERIAALTGEREAD